MKQKSINQFLKSTINDNSIVNFVNTELYQKIKIAIKEIYNNYILNKTVYLCFGVLILELIKKFVIIRYIKNKIKKNK